MRKLITANTITANFISANFISANFISAMTLLILLSGSVAVAQNSARTGNSATSPQTSPNSGVAVEAPIGHRQPRASDVPSEKGVTNPNPEDAALDRKIKSICRGC
jgi:hypothetical protein